VSPIDSRLIAAAKNWNLTPIKRFGIVVAAFYDAMVCIHAIFFATTTD
jgi:hypothetical protein